MEKTAMMQPLQSAAAVPRAARSAVTAPSTADPPRPGLRALTGGKPALDRVSISDEAQRVAAAQEARASEAGNNDRLQDAGPRSAEDRAERVLSELKERFFSRSGEEGFDAKFDFNSDGVINVQDLGLFREKLAGGSPPSGPASPNLTATALTPPSQTPVDATAVTQSTEPVEPDSATLAVTLDSIRSAFFTREGDDGFNSAADLNGDGVVNVRDLGLFRASQPDVAEPVQPVPEPLTSVGGDEGTASTGVSTNGLAVDTAAPDDGADASATSGATAAFVNPAATQEADTSGATPAVAAADLRSTLLEQLRDAFSARAENSRVNVADFVSVREEV